MRPIKGHVLISAPLERVFDFVADECNEPRYNPRMVRAEKTTPGAIGVGTRFEATMRGARDPARVTMSYTKFSRPLILTSVSRMQDMDIEGTLDFSTEGGQTRLAWSWTLQPRGFMRCISPAIRAMGKRQERNNWEGLKDYLEKPDRGS